MSEEERSIEKFKKLSDINKIKNLIKILDEDYNNYNYNYIDNLITNYFGLNESKLMFIDLIYKSLDKLKSKNNNSELSSSIPTKGIICKINEFLKEKECKKVIEIGSGSGLWIALLKIIQNNDKTITFHATDNYVNPDYKYKYTTVEKIDALEAIEKYKNSDCLFLCWPPSQDVVDKKGEYSAGDMLEQFKGNYLIYIGEKYGDEDRATGDDKFFNLVEKYWNLEEEPIENPGKIGIFEHSTKIFLYKRKQSLPTIQDTLISNENKFFWRIFSRKIY